MLSAPITEEELKMALFSMHDGQAMGSDGFSVEFFKFFWSDLEKYLFESIICSLNKGEMNISQRCGVITLIPKKDKPTDKVANWRPIALLNVDYKIISKALALCMKKIISKLIHQDQRGFIPNWYIGDNIIELNSIIYEMEEEETDALVSIHFYKVFDSIEWSYIEKVLDYFQFPDLSNIGSLHYIII